MAKRIEGTTPKQDGYRMPGEFEEQECCGHGETTTGVRAQSLRR